MGKGGLKANGKPLTLSGSWVWTDERFSKRGRKMAEHGDSNGEAAAIDIAVHRASYKGFIGWFKWGAVVALIIVLVVVVIIA